MWTAEVGIDPQTQDRLSTTTVHSLCDYGERWKPVVGNDISIERLNHGELDRWKSEIYYYQVANDM